MKHFYNNRRQGNEKFIYLESMGTGSSLEKKLPPKTEEEIRVELMDSIKNEVEAVLSALTPQEKLKVLIDEMLITKAEIRKTNEGARDEILSLLDILVQKAKSVSGGHGVHFLENLEKIQNILHTSTTNMPLLLEQIAKNWYQFFEGIDFEEKADKEENEQAKSKLIEDFEVYLGELSTLKRLSVIKKSAAIYAMFETTIRDAAREEVAQKNGK